MSNFLAIATVTASLKKVILSAISSGNKIAADLDVTTVRPDTLGTINPPTGVNIYLYQATPSAALRNMALPSRTPDGQMVRRPQVALDLHYLLSFYGDDLKLEPQRLLGITARTLNAHPILTKGTISSAISDDVYKPFIGESDLAEQIDLIRLTPQNLSLDELSKLWNIFFQTKYILSAAYTASVAIIEEEAPVKTALPVRERGLYVAPFHQPYISSVEPQVLEFSPAAKLRLKGRNLKAKGARVQMGSASAEPDDESTEGEILITLPQGVRAGINPIQVIHDLMMGVPEPHEGFQSNVAAIVIRPRLDEISFKNEIEPGKKNPGILVKASPPTGMKQKAVLLINQPAKSKDDRPPAFSLTPAPRTDEAGPLVFSTASVPSAVYLARLRVDGAESALITDSRGRYAGPTVEVK